MSRAGVEPAQAPGGSGPRAAYEHRRASLASSLATDRAAFDRTARSRGILFLGVVAALVAADFLSGWGTRLALVAATLALVAFVVRVRRHGRLRERIRRGELLLALSEEGLERMDRAWHALDGRPHVADVPWPDPGDDHPYAGDLDVFGHASLAWLMGPVTSTPGREVLATWLRGFAEPSDLRERQVSVRALAPLLDARHELAATGRAARPPDPLRVEHLLAWAEEPTWLLDRPGIRAASWVLPVAAVVLAGLDFFGPLGSYWLIVLVLHAAILRKVHARIIADYERAGGGADEIRGYAEQIRQIGTWDAPSGRLAELRAALTVEHASASDALDRLGRLVEIASGRDNAVHGLLTWVVMLDLHVHRAFERWKRAHGASARRWLDALGEIEALCALAALAHDHPEWAFPSFHDEAVIEVGSMAHPLLEPGVAVANPVSVGPPGTLLLVTGSNMSGKSTLLRALGANVVLAGAGAPVCAASMTLPAVALHTTMLVGDSLEDGVSRFMAELLVLRRIVEAARATGPDDPPLLYLMDEILQGTNSGERRVAARTVLRHLLRERAMGAVTTHDLELIAAPDLEDASRAFHFRETTRRDEGRPRLEFDYVLRPGLATTRNALALLEMVGLGERPELPHEDDGSTVGP